MAQASGTMAIPVGEEKAGKTLSKLDSRMKMEIAPMNGMYLSAPWPTFSSSRSLMPNPSGLVRSISAACWKPPGRSTESRVRRIMASSDADDENYQRHDDIFRDGVVVIGGLNMESVEKLKGERTQ